MTTLLQATKNDLEFYFCFIGDAWIGKPGAFWRFPCLWLYQSVRFRLHRTPAEEVLAAKLANCEEFAEKLPDKWNTNIGENGCALSGGERQRISIARAFLKDAPIILLDEATASLDVENETAIQGALSRLIKNKTVLIIAHRMRTVAGADQVVVLSGGIVAELYARQSCTPGRDCMPTWWICSRQARTGRSENDGGFYLGKGLAFS